MADLQSDPFIQNVINAIPRDVQRTLSKAQLDAITEALGSVRMAKRHAVDLRLSIPLIFKRYYFVLLVGEDRRRHVRQVIAKNQKSALSLAKVIWWAIALIVTFGAMTVMGEFWIYLLKSALGIDLIPASHLIDVINPF
ncbi:hypothetical protein D3093_19375 (plasmid) [Azospirillum argentinense]|uniref:3-phosphoshikimate 1-carboxyvinyltransferase n=1 Tax=Azospirillum argentinense TaxID=2970906 RepID=A0A4D8PJ96_9PROT|nr:hypothetical protein [Azospirillum argentinense]QCN97404.1 hypothetical protein D3093_19375 [Azospirillum argentinense]